MESKKQRLRLLNEHNREVSLASARLSHCSNMRLNPASGRDKIIASLKQTAARRRDLAARVDIPELWEILNSESEWIDVPTMTEFAFSNEFTGDHEAAVIRAFFDNRLYFKFGTDGFFPNTPEQVEQMMTRLQEEDRKNRLIENGAAWLQAIRNGGGTRHADALTAEEKEIVGIIRSVYLFEKESPHFEIGRRITAMAGMEIGEQLFNILVKLQIWDPDENIDIFRFDIAADFSTDTTQNAHTLMCSPDAFSNQPERRDLTALPMMTIDGQATLDFDDALSVENRGDHYILGVHIADVGHYVKKDSPLDRDALARGSSIYMPDRKIPMLPQDLAEDLCSLKAGKIRPAVSTMIRMTTEADIIDYEIFPSTIRIKDQLTYHDANMAVESDCSMAILHRIAKKFRQKRFSDGAVHISLPEVNVWLDEEGDPAVSRVNRESPSRMLVAEIMIMANWVMARFLADKGLPAVFRTQPAPKQRLYKEDEGTLFQNWMQRKHLNRFVLNCVAEPHSGLGLNAYVTATSPIRKYFDLVTQRQIRSVFGLETPYAADDMRQIMHILEQPMAHVGRIQFRRKRYWLLKHLESRIGEKEEALVLSRLRNNYQVLITEYMIECPVPLSAGIKLKPEDLIRVTIQHVNARRDVLSVFPG